MIATKYQRLHPYVSRRQQLYRLLWIRSYVVNQRWRPLTGSKLILTLYHLVALPYLGKVTKAFPLTPSGNEMEVYWSKLFYPFIKPSYMLLILYHSKLWIHIVLDRSSSHITLLSSLVLKLQTSFYLSAPVLWNSLPSDHVAHIRHSILTYIKLTCRWSVNLFLKKS